MEVYRIYQQSIPIPSLPAEYLFNLRHTNYANLGMSYFIETLIALDMYKIGMNFAQAYDICMFIENDHILYKHLVKEANRKLNISLNNMMTSYAEMDKITEYDTSQYKDTIRIFISQTFSRIKTLNNSIL